MEKINKWLKFFGFLLMSLILIGLSGCYAAQTLQSPSSITENPTLVINPTPLPSASLTVNSSTSQISTPTLSASPTPTTKPLPITTLNTIATTTISSAQSATTTQIITPKPSSPVSSTTPVPTSSPQSTPPPTINSPISSPTPNGTVPPLHPFMKFTPEQLLELRDAYENASASSLRPQEAGVPLPKSFSLLQDLKYNPVDRDQGVAGNCWVWAGTGIMEIALDVEKSIKDRLSIQYFDSNYNGGSGPSWAGNGGGINSFANFYANQAMAIPWSNTNASYQDEGSTTGASVPARSIGLLPNYPVSHSIQPVTIFPSGVSQTTAIAAIENTLVQNEGVWFAFWFSSTEENNFYNFWGNQPETSVWQPSDDSSVNEGHAVLCVGYDDEDPNNPYWIMLNSWGTASEERPDGLFRVSMNINYNSLNFQWETLENIYPPTPPSNLNVKIQSVILPSGIIANSGVSYPTTIRLVNNGSTDTTVTWQAHSSVTGNYDNGNVAVPKNGYVDVTKSYVYTTAGPASLSYRIFYNGGQLDSWSGTLNVKAIPNVKIQSVTLPPSVKVSSGALVYSTTFRLVNNESVDITVKWQGNSSITGNFDSGSVIVPENSYVDVTKGYYYIATGPEKITYIIYYNGTQIDSWSGTHMITSFVPNVKIQSVTLPPSVKVSSGALVYNTTFRLVNNELVDVTVNWQGNSSITGNFDSGSVTVPKNSYVDVTKVYYYITTGPEKITYTIYYSGTQIDSWSGIHVITSFVPNVKIQNVTLPSGAKASSGPFVFTTYSTTFRLVNTESINVTVNWQAHSSVTGNFDSGSVTVPKNSYIDVTRSYYYTVAGTVNLTYTICYNVNQIDTWSGTMNVLPW